MCLRLSLSSLAMLLASCGGRTVDDAPAAPIGSGGSGSGGTSAVGRQTQDAASLPPSSSSGSGSGSTAGGGAQNQDAAPTSPGSPTPLPGLVSLVEWPSGAWGLALDSVNLYWADGQNVMRTPKLGGTTVQLTDAATMTGAPTSWVGVSDGKVFADQSGAVISVPTTGGATTTLVPWQWGAFDVTAGPNGAFWISSGWDGSGITRLPIAGGAPVPVEPNASPWKVILDATNVYWVDYFQGTVMRASQNGGAPTTLATGQNEPTLVAVNSTDVFWSVPNDGTILSVPLTGGASTTLATGQYVTEGMTADEANVYWTAWGRTGADDTVVKVSVHGGEPVTIASQQDSPSQIVVDDTSVYWSGKGGIMRATPK